MTVCTQKSARSLLLDEDKQMYKEEKKGGEKKEKGKWIAGEKAELCCDSGLLPRSRGRRVLLSGVSSSSGLCYSSVGAEFVSREVVYYICGRSWWED